MTMSQVLQTAPALDEAIAEAPFYISATGTATRPRRTLKYDDMFAVLDSHGDIGASTGEADGLFYKDTRFLSRLELRVNGLQPLLLGSNLRDDNTALSVDLTNPDFFVDGRIVCKKTCCISLGRLSCGGARRISGWPSEIMATALSASLCQSSTGTISPTFSRCAVSGGRNEAN